MAKTRLVQFRLTKTDRKRLELISATYGLTYSAAFRASLIAMCRQLGLDTELPEDSIK
jgi:hypothetical protein